MQRPHPDTKNWTTRETPGKQTTGPDDKGARGDTHVQESGSLIPSTKAGTGPPPHKRPTQAKPKTMPNQNHFPKKEPHMQRSHPDACIWQPEVGLEDKGARGDTYVQEGVRLITSTKADMHGAALLLTKDTHKPKTMPKLHLTGARRPGHAREACMKEGRDTRVRTRTMGGGPLWEVAVHHEEAAVSHPIRVRFCQTVGLGVDTSDTLLRCGPGHLLPDGGGAAGPRGFTPRHGGQETRWLQADEGGQLLRQEGRRSRICRSLGRTRAHCRR